MVVTVGEAELDDPSFKYGNHLLNDCVCVCVCVCEIMVGSFTLHPKNYTVAKCQFSFWKFDMAKYLFVKGLFDAMFTTS
jgi:hypothetical protein